MLWTARQILSVIKHETLRTRSNLHHKHEVTQKEYLSTIHTGILLLEVEVYKDTEIPLIF